MKRAQLGLALPTVISVMVVLVVLGTALWGMGIGDALQSARMEHRIQAEYIARSGAEAYVRHLISNSNEISSRLGQTSEPTDLGNGQFTVTLEYGINGYYVRSEAVVNGVSHEAKLALKSTDPFDGVAVYATTISTSGNATPIVQTDPHGGVYTLMSSEDFGDEDHINAVFVKADLNWETGIDYEDPVFPCGSGWENIGPTFRGGTISTNSYADSVQLSGTQGVLNVELGDGGRVDLMVDELQGTGQASINLKGKGTFVIWVWDQMHFQGNFQSDVCWEDTEIIIFISSEGSSNEEALRLGGSANLHGAVYAPGRDVRILGSGLLQGSIIADSLELSGQAQSQPEKFIYRRIMSDAAADLSVYTIGSWLR